MENIWFLAWTEKRVGGCSEQNEGCLERESIPTSLMWASQKRVHCWETFLKRIVKYRIQGRRQTRKREDTYMGADFLSKNRKLSFFASAIYHILMTQVAFPSAAKQADSHFILVKWDALDGVITWQITIRSHLLPKIVRACLFLLMGFLLRVVETTGCS